MNGNNLLKKLNKSTAKLAAPIRVGVAGGVIAGQSLAASIPLFACGGVKLVSQKLGLQDTRMGKAADKVIIDIADNWIGINNQLIEHLLPERDWRIHLPEGLGMDKKYLMICNHQSWVDTTVVQYVSEGRLPLTRFFAKHELLYIPIVGQTFYLLDFPMMKRHSRDAIAKNPKLANRDLDEARRACQLLKDKPFVLLNYLEGTRNTPDKHQSQQSPYRHLLKPKAGGLALAISSLGEEIDGILDMTIVYPDGVPSYQDLWSGRLKRLAADIRPVVMDETLFNQLKAGAYNTDTVVKDALFDWLDALWQQKDARIDEMLAEFN